MKYNEKNNNTGLISVIVPVYNVEKYLKQCLDSLLKQTYKNIEIIIVDDGSSDNSGKISDEYHNKYENIKVIHKKNEGLGFARNTGLKNINGEFVIFVDSDDYIDSDFIENLYKKCIDQNVDMCKTGFRRIDDDHKILALVKNENNIYRENEVKDIFLPRMIGSLPDKKDSIEMCVCGAIYKTSYILKYDIKFPSERVLISEDLIFNIEYMQHAKSASTIDYVGYNYRYNPSSLTTKYREDRFEASKYFYTEVKQRLLSLGYDNTTILRLSRIFFIYIKMCLSQEKNKVSHKSSKESLNAIEKICKDPIVVEVINNYPINKLHIKQKIFINLIKNKCIRIIYFLLEMNIL